MLASIVRVFLVLFLPFCYAIAALVGVPFAANAAPLLSQPVVIATGSLFSFSGERPTILGVHDGALAPCPSSPNCVSSQSQDSHRIEPLTYEGTPEDAIAQLKAVIESLPRTEIIAADDHYLYAEFTSALMGFVDDVEFYIDPNAPVIHVRSASRLGDSDLDVNRKRVELIRNKLSGLSLAFSIR